MQVLNFTAPDDWHLHLRDGAALEAVLADTTRQFRRAVVMPNLRPPVTTVAAALAYRDRIVSLLPEATGFEPLMALYLTDETSVDEVRRAAEAPAVVAFKLYPAGATTNSDAGVSELSGLDQVLAAMEHHGVPLLVHGEVTDPSVDIFDREQVFIERHLAPMADRFPGLRMVLEHITTREGAAFVRESREGIGATITAHHLLFNRNAMLAGGIRPHFYCLPVLKREPHREALLAAATSGNPKFFLGTDSAPHARVQKESACGCAGSYTARAALALYATAFESVGALDRLEAFASFHGADFYGLPRNDGRVCLEKSAWRVPDRLAYGEDDLVPFLAGESLSWRCAGLSGILA